jgi:hypothetical protein
MNLGKAKGDAKCHPPTRNRDKNEATPFLVEENLFDPVENMALVAAVSQGQLLDQ